MLALSIVGAFATVVAPAQAAAPGPKVEIATGFDACTAPTPLQMRRWWYQSPYRFIGIYIGGSARGCSQPELTRWWISKNSSLGWGFLPLWVGPQAPCTSFSHAFSYSASIATAQGQHEADLAADASDALGFPPNSYIYYDLEGFDITNSSCVTAAQFFINGWEYQLHTVRGHHGGVYGSSCASALNAYRVHSNVPEAIDAADWNGHGFAYNLPCIPNTAWPPHQRIHQYTGGHDESYGGIRINIDADCADGPIQVAIAVKTGCVK